MILKTEPMEKKASAKSISARRIQLGRASGTVMLPRSEIRLVLVDFNFGCTDFYFDLLAGMARYMLVSGDGYCVGFPRVHRKLQRNIPLIHDSAVGSRSLPIGSTVTFSFHDQLSNFFVPSNPNCRLFCHNI